MSGLGQQRATGFYALMRQRLVGQIPPGGGSEQQQQGNLLSMKDPVIVGIKSNLIISSRIGLEPISQTFAKVAFMCERRMVLKLGAVWRAHSLLPGQTKTVVVLQLSEKLDASNECPFVFPVDKVLEVLRSLFRRIRKWRSIHFLRSLTENDGGEVAVAWNRIVSQFLDTIVAESNGETIDVRGFYCTLRTVDEGRIARFLQLIAPDLRRMQIPLHDQEDHPPIVLKKLAKALSACQKLRHLWMTYTGSQRLPTDFICKILALPKLNDLVLGNCVNYFTCVDNDRVEHKFVRRQCPGLASISIDQDWLEAIGRLPQLPMFNNMQHFKLMTGSDKDVLLDVVWQIVGEMRSPASVDFDYVFSDISWQNVWKDYLPMVYKTGANVERNVGKGLPTIQLKTFRKGLATLPPSVRNALTEQPNLASAPVDDGRYKKLVFSFDNGAKLTVKTYW